MGLEPEYYFAKNITCNLTCHESVAFSESSLHSIFEFKNFRFPFSMKNSLGSEM